VRLARGRCCNQEKPLVQIQAAYSSGALSKAADAQWTFLASL
jgi:hypothetical protein